VRNYLDYARNHLNGTGSHLNNAGTHLNGSRSYLNVPESFHDAKIMLSTNQTINLSMNVVSLFLWLPTVRVCSGRVPWPIHYPPLLPLPASPELANCSETRLMYTLCWRVVHFYSLSIFLSITHSESAMNST
jgi:hypothetical protein